MKITAQKCHLLLALALLLGGISTMAQPSSDTRNWIDHAGIAPDFQIARTRRAFERQLTTVRATLKQLLGSLPPRPAVPNIRTLRREDHGSYWQEHFEFDNGAGATVPGVLLLPKQRVGPAPAILWNHWHGGQYDGGKIEIFQTNHTPVAPGPALAESGYVVLAIDAYGFGERHGHGPGGLSEKGAAAEMTAAKFNLWIGRTLWGMIVRDDLMALDYLASRPEVDAQRIGVTGISMGATRTWWLMALDDRPKAAVAVCCLTRYRDLLEAEMLKAHGIYYFVPGLLQHFDSEAIIACIAPRPFLSLAGADDAGSPVPGIRQIEVAAGPAWRLWNRAEDFRSVIYPNVGHVYTPTMWQEMVTWFDSHLNTPTIRKTSSRPGTVHRILNCLPGQRCPTSRSPMQSRQSFALGIAAACAVQAAPPSGIPSHYHLLYQQSCASTNAIKDFVFTDAAAWKITEGNGKTALELTDQSKYIPAVRSPVNIAMIANQVFDDFILEADLLQTSKEYGHRDMCLFYGFQSPTRFYYTHIATKADDHAHNCFVVKDAPRTKIAKETTGGFDWGQGIWHKVRLERKASDGSIRVWVDDFTKPIMTAEDQTFGAGWVGFGSFDDTGKVANIRIWGKSATKKRVPEFPKATTK